MIIWYNNSILASLVSIISCLIGIGGIDLIREGETGGGIALIAVAVIGVLAGKFISDNKTVKDHLKKMEKEKSQAESRTFTGSSGASAAGSAGAAGSTGFSAGTAGAASSTRSSSAGGSSGTGGSGTSRSGGTAAGSGSGAYSGVGASGPSYCAHCGAKLPGPVRFCPSCGKAVLQAGTSAGSSTTASAGSSSAASAGSASNVGSVSGGARALTPAEAEKIVNQAINDAYEYAEKDDHNTELHILLNALSVVPDNAQLLNRIGRAYRLSGDPDKAIKYYRKALEVDGSEPTVYGNLGVALFTLGRYQEARPYLERALQMMEEKPGAVTRNDRGVMYANYANCIGKMGDLNGARENLVKAEQFGYSKEKSNLIWNQLL